SAIDDAAATVVIEHDRHGTGVVSVIGAGIARPMTVPSGRPTELEGLRRRSARVARARSVDHRRDRLRRRAIRERAANDEESGSHDSSIRTPSTKRPYNAYIVNRRRSAASDPSEEVADGEIHRDVVLGARDRMQRGGDGGSRRAQRE